MFRHVNVFEALHWVARRINGIIRFRERRSILSVKTEHQSCTRKMLKKTTGLSELKLRSSYLLGQQILFVALVLGLLGVCGCLARQFLQFNTLLRQERGVRQFRARPGLGVSVFRLFGVGKSRQCLVLVGSFGEGYHVVSKRSLS